ncbi:MAG TPA: Asp-tRNA(Asn)/Glu-tRNA(Gln) amidotransferase subunit GatC [Flavisolibacter sp.]|jgi:aspartyl-tRNA(Asn)/glutamyl-tRNA(Gln) amidotransferase subunit C|nr:Asp-tRNA(Asn)/Glu-tRNA(Gln) amidotransferase subunit GatC [Flavisolibacter sp.]
MQVNDALIDKLARLSMLEITEDERNDLKADLTKMISFVEKLNELDTTGVEPLIHMCEAENILREDKTGNMISREEALKNAPEHDNIYFKVPKVIKKPQ